jgi:hypothetical protein
MTEIEVVAEEDNTIIGTYGGAVSENYMIKLVKLHKENRIPKYLVEVSLYGERLIRKMARIDTMDGWRYADIITGSLYDPNTGKCNSADIKIVKVRKDIPEVKKKAVKKTTKAKK